MVSCFSSCSPWSDKATERKFIGGFDWNLRVSIFYSNRETINFFSFLFSFLFYSIFFHLQKRVKFCRLFGFVGRGKKRRKKRDEKSKKSTGNRFNHAFFHFQRYDNWEWLWEKILAALKFEAKLQQWKKFYSKITPCLIVPPQCLIHFVINHLFFLWLNTSLMCLRTCMCSSRELHSWWKPETKEQGMVKKGREKKFPFNYIFNLILFFPLFRFLIKFVCVFRLNIARTEFAAFFSIIHLHVGTFFPGCVFYTFSLLFESELFLLANNISKWVRQWIMICGIANLLLKWRKSTQISSFQHLVVASLFFNLL